MARFSLDGYRKQWPRIGGVLAMALGGVTALTSGRMSKPQTLSAVNFGALLVHQYEEYQDPGWFPGQFNHGLFHSDSPRNYVLNTNSALCVNVEFAYPYYIAPIVFPKVRWLGLSPVLFGMAQAVGHGIIFPRLAGDKYSPGFLASALLHVPIGITYIRAVQADRPLTRGEWAAAIAYTVAFAAVGVAGPNLMMHDKNSPYAFTAAQMGHHDVQALRPLPGRPDRRWPARLSPAPLRSWCLPSRAEVFGSRRLAITLQVPPRAGPGDRLGARGDA